MSVRCAVYEAVDKAVRIAVCVLACLIGKGVRAEKAETPGTSYFRHNVTGAFVYEAKAGPNSGISFPFLNNAPGFTIDYLFQPQRWLALDVGFAQIVRPIGSSVCCQFGTSAEDELCLVPFGARYVWESRTNRLRLTAGGGGAYVNHTIGSESAGGFGFTGWGGQFVGSGDVALTRSGRLRLDFTSRYYLASPRPSPGPDIGVRDHFHVFVFGPGVTFSFR